MSRTRSLAIVPLLASLAAAGGFAGARISIRTDLPAIVVVDGKLVGKTPLDVKLLYAGDRLLEVQHRATGMSYSYRVRSPQSGMVSRIINSSFQGAAPVSAPIVNQVTLAAAPEPLAKPSGEDRRMREKIRIRNTILGAGLANALFNHGPHRHGLFVGLFWLGVLNELLHSK